MEKTNKRRSFCDSINKERDYGRKLAEEEELTKQ